MIKTVCFDFFNTLARYEPSREDTYVSICSEFGITADAQTLSKSLPVADKFWRDENRRSDIDNRTKDDQMAFWAQYITLILKGTGTAIDIRTALAIMGRMRQFNWEFKLFDDSLEILNILNDRKVQIGLISNVGKEMEDTYRKLGIQSYLTFTVTSFEVGCDKPDPKIFRIAIEKSKVKPEEMLYIGDQYEQDILGARNVNIQGILIDRRGWNSNVTDCPVVQRLISIIDYL
ncbi:MAG TPA: hypothetical protein DCX22_04200 [Dehalococcoidia bacterium]|nr:hypothetical protein [Dehalococcoidia bacterium]